MKRYELKVERDDDPMNPRTDWDNITTIICFHNRYNIGDKHDYKSSDFDSWEDLKNQIDRDYKVLSYKPLYMYDHSGITISTRPFNCNWDSGQVGWIIIDEKQLNLMCGKDFDRSENNLSSIINGEVKTYDEYLTGDVYRYEVYEIETCSLGHEHRNLIESCGSYYDEGDCRDEGLSVLHGYTEKELVSE